MTVAAERDAQACLSSLVIHLGQYKLLLIGTGTIKIAAERSIR